MYKTKLSNIFAKIFDGYEQFDEDQIADCPSWLLGNISNYEKLIDVSLKASDGEYTRYLCVFKDECEKLRGFSIYTNMNGIDENSMPDSYVTVFDIMAEQKTIYKEVE